MEQTYYLPRYLSCDEFLNRATHNYNIARQAPIYGESWGNNRFLTYPKEISDLDQEVMLSMFELPHGIPYPNLDLLGQFYRVSREGQVPYTEVMGTTLSQFYPGWTPLIYHLMAEKVMNAASWQFPSSSHLRNMIRESSVTYSSVDKCTFKEIILGRSSDSRCADFCAWVQEKRREDQFEFPVDAMFCDVLYVDFPEHYMDEYYDKLRTNNPSPVRVKSGTPGEKSYMPIRLVFGGRNWIASIKWNITHEPAFLPTDDYFLLHTDNIQPDMRNFLENLPTLVSNTVGLNNFLFYLKDMYGLNVNVSGAHQTPRFVSISSVAVAAGFRYTDQGSASMNMITTGQPDLRGACFADGMWAIPLDQQKTEYKLYLISLIQSTRNCYITLMLCLMKNLFPDPDIMCDLFELCHSDTFSYLASLVNSCLEGKIAGNMNPSGIDSRQAMVMSLEHHGIGPATEGLRLMSQLIPNWPTITHGGARDLHQVRAFAAEQYAHISSARFVHPILAPNLSRILSVSSDVVDLLFYNRCLDDLETESVPVTAGLGPNQGLKDMILDLDPYHVSDEELINVRSIHGSSRKSSILEWGRLNVDLIEQLMFRLNKLAEKKMIDNFWFQRTSIYEGLRLIYKRTMNINTFKVQAIEHTIQKRSERIDLDIEHCAKNLRSGSDQMQENRLKRVDMMKSVVSKNRDISRVGQHQQVHDKIPGDNTARNRLLAEKRKAKKEAAKLRQGYIPGKEFQQIGKKKTLPAKPASHRRSGIKGDLRRVLDYKRYSQGELKAKVDDHQRGPGSRVNSKRDPQGELRVRVDYHQRGPVSGANSEPLGREVHWWEEEV